MTETKLIDHLFRHQYGKMVSILTRIFGLQHLELVEDAVQDTFVTAMKAWRQGMPKNPEAWLTTAAKNRVLDLFRKINADQTRNQEWSSGTVSIAINEMFLDTEISDSQLRMIFTACNPELKAQDQLAFALKTISGFNASEIASALLLKEETVKKRLMRARKAIAEKRIAFEIPTGDALPARLQRVLEVIYLIFNEGFHSNRKDALVREELCGEALRLCKMLLANKHTASPDVYALFALFCFHSARLKSKTGPSEEVLSLKEQDRSTWYKPLINLGFSAMERAKDGVIGPYHLEAAIAAEHISAASYDQTNWARILEWYTQLDSMQPSAFIKLNMATVQLQLKHFDQVEVLLDSIDINDLEQRSYLLSGLWAEYYNCTGDSQKALSCLDEAIAEVNNSAELEYLKKKRQSLAEGNEF